MTLDDRQLQLVKGLLKDVGDGLVKLPFDQGADRCEAVAAVLGMIGAHEVAEQARHLAMTLREGRESHEELKRMLTSLA